MKLASQIETIKWGTSAQEGKGNPNFNGGKYVDDKGYLRVLRPEHPKQNHGYVYEHRLVMEQLLGRILEKWETVHHINEIKLDNRVENLFLTTVSEHSSIHREGKSRTEVQKRAVSDNMKKRASTRSREGGRFKKER